MTGGAALHATDRDILVPMAPGTAIHVFVAVAR